jgi:hypothetical protein
MGASGSETDSSLWRRFSSAILVLLLHVLLVLAFLKFMIRPPEIVTRPERILEMLIRLPEHRAAQPESPPSAAPHPARGGAPSGPVPSLAPALPQPDVQGLGRSLFGCAPENLSSLSPEQRSHCPGGLTRPDDTVVAEPPSHVKDPARRAAEMRAKNTPGRVPCTYVGDAPGPYGPVATVMVSPLCALDGLLNGFPPLTGLPK